MEEGKLYQKQTESWEGNSQKGTEVKVVKIVGNFVSYKYIRKFLCFRFTLGQTFVLNKWSFSRIFVNSTEQPL